MSASIPITNSMMAGAQQFMPLGASGEAAPIGGATGGGGTSIVPNATVSVGGFNTHLHVGLGVLVAMGVIVALHLGGFRFAFDAGMGRS